MKRIVKGRIAASAWLSAGLLVPALLAGTAAPARADVETLSLPNAVTVGSGTVTVAGTVGVAASATGLRSASLWFRYPGSTTSTLVGSASSREPGALNVSAVLDATRLTPGLTRLRILDDVDGEGRSVLIHLRRRTRVAVTSVTAGKDGRMAVAVRVRHYDPRTGRYVASKLSPVRLQERVSSHWVTLTSVTSDRAGLATAVVPAGSGSHRYRAVRPAGATVSSGTSKSVTTTVG